MSQELSHFSYDISLKKIKEIYKKLWIQDELNGERFPKAEGHTVESSILKPSV